jgi:lipocalin
MHTLKLMVFIYFLTGLAGCSSFEYSNHTLEVSRKELLGRWYVLGARGTFFDSDMFNAYQNVVENKVTGKLDVEYVFQKKNAKGRVKKLEFSILNSPDYLNWYYEPFWPLKFRIVFIDRGPNLKWMVVGDPNEKRAWILSRRRDVDKDYYRNIIYRIQSKGYSIENIEQVHHNGKLK